MTITKDVEGEIYRNLICYAIDHSDSVIVVITDKPPMVTTVEEAEKRWKEYLPHKPIPDIAWDNWNRAEKQAQQGQVIYKEHYLPFVQSLAPHIIKRRHNTVWPSTEIFSCNCTYTIALCRICDELRQLLLKPGSYFSWRYPRYPEDLSFFKDNRCWLYASSHEEYIEFLPRSLEEYDFVASLGVELPEPYRPIEDDEYYWEDYSL